MVEGGIKTQNNKTAGSFISIIKERAIKSAN